MICGLKKIRFVKTRMLPYMLIIPAVSICFFPPSALSMPVNEKQETLTADLNDIQGKVAQNGFLEGATFSLWRSNGEHLEIKAKRVEFKKKRIGWFYTPFARVLALEEVNIVLEREHEELLAIRAGKAEIRIAGGKLVVTSGAQVNLLGTSYHVNELLWNLSTQNLSLDGHPLQPALLSKIWPSN